MIVDELIYQALAMVQNRKVIDVRAGLGYTCVMLEGGACGLAAVNAVINDPGKNWDTGNVLNAFTLHESDTIPHFLPRCDVVVITATSVINHSIDEVISYCENAKEVCIVGPSTPLCPEVFRKYNVTLLAGSVVKNPGLILQIVSQGGGTMSMKPAIEQVLVRI